MTLRKLVFLLWLGSFLVTLILTGANLYWGNLNQDEGWYLYASRLVSRGELPYRDFAYTQGPVMPYVYALAQPLVDGFGVAGGRIVTAGFGLMTAVACALLATGLAVRGSRSVAAFLAFTLIGVNVYQSYFCAVVKTYSLCAFLLTLGFLALRRGLVGRYRVFTALSGFLLVFAAGTRVSVGVVLPIIFAVLLRQAWLCSRSRAGMVPENAGQWVRQASWFAGGAIVGCCTVFLPFMIMCWENFLFYLVQYHSGRDIGGIAKQIVFKGGFVSRLVQSYFVAVVLFLAAIVWRLFHLHKGDDESQPEPQPEVHRVMSICLWSAVLAITLIHFSAPFPYDDYQVAIFPLFAVGIAAYLTRLVSDERARAWLLAVVFLASTGAAFSSPINQDWMIKERDRIWWRVKEESSLQKLRDTGAVLRELAGDGKVLLTQDAYLAVEAGLEVPHGLELGPFSYYPDMDEERAKKLNVVNSDMLKRILQTSEASVAAFSGYSLAIRCPEVQELSSIEQGELWSIVKERYKTHDEIPHFGQALTTLKVLVGRER